MKIEPLDPQGFLAHRRNFVIAGAIAAVTTCTGAFATSPDWGKQEMPAPAAFWTQPRWVWLKHAETGEEIKLVYWTNGQLVPDAHQRLSWFLRDTRFQRLLSTDSPLLAAAVKRGKIARNQLTPWAVMDPVVLDILYAHCAWLEMYGMSRPLITTSGFRHFFTNEMTEGAALAGWHPKAGAVDFHVPGVPVEQVARFGVWLAAGGVGLYRKKNFTHVDRGRQRSWRG